MTALEAALAELRALALAQSDALVGGRLDEAADLLQRRRQILDAVRRADGGRGAAAAEDILTIDREMIAALRSEMDAVSEKLNDIAKMKDFLRRASPRPSHPRVTAIA